MRESGTTENGQEVTKWTHLYTHAQNLCHYIRTSRGGKIRQYSPEQGFFYEVCWKHDCGLPEMPVRDTIIRLSHYLFRIYLWKQWQPIRQKVQSKYVRNIPLDIRVGKAVVISEYLYLCFLTWNTMRWLCMLIWIVQWTKMNEWLNPYQSSNQ